MTHLKFLLILCFAGLFVSQNMFAGRYYNAAIGRFLQVDPLLDQYPSHSPYVFVANNPLRYIDPNGLEWYEVTEEYTDDDGNTQTRKVWQYYADTPEMDVWNGEYDENGNKVMIQTQGIVELLTFDGSSLSWLQEDGSMQSWSAVSGILDAFGNTQPGLQAAKDMGPIPEGWYLVDPDQTLAARNASSFYDLVKWAAKAYSWGMFETPIFAMDGTRNYASGRNNAFIHGGSVPGSIGCIDLTKSNYYFHSKFLQNGKVLPLKVGY